MHPSKISENMLLDDSFVKCFAPIHTIQNLLGSSRINIKKNKVTPTTVKQKLYTFIWIICFSVSFCYFQLYYYKALHYKDTILYVTCAIGAIVQYVSYLSNIIHVRFCKNMSCTEIYLTIQRIDDILQLKKYKNLKHSQYYWNIFALILIILPFECGFYYYVVSTVEYPILTIFWAIGLLITYLELLLTGSLIYYLTIRLKYLNKIIRYNLDVKYCGGKSSPSTVNQELIVTTDGSKNLDLEKFLLSLKEILRSYKMITEVFSFTVFNVAATSFTWTLVIIEAMVESMRGESHTEIDVITTSLWIVFYFLLLSALALVSDIFIEEVGKTKLYCIFVMSYYFEGPIRKGAKDMLNTIQFTQPVFSVIGIFVLDKSLPFKLIGIITTNVVVLIQFTM